MTALIAKARETPFSDVMAYARMPILALRTLKSDVVMGLPKGLAEKLEAAAATMLARHRAAGHIAKGHAVAGHAEQAGLRAGPAGFGADRPF